MPNIIHRLQVVSRLSFVVCRAASRRGIATLPTIIGLTILIVIVGIAITSLSLTETFIAAGQKQSSLALVYAETGARDALERLARNKNYSCSVPDCYAIDFVASGCSTNDGCARVSISSTTGSLADPKYVTSTGQVGSNIRKISVGVIYDISLNGEIATTTWQEITN